MEIIFLVIGLAVGVPLGFAGSHYMVKRDPEKLQRWTQEAKRLGQRL